MIEKIYNRPWQKLIFDAAKMHNENWDPCKVHNCSLLSIKTGGCTEDCKYCSQSVRNKTFVKPTPLMKEEDILEAARRAKESGSSRFCMGAAWREMGEKKKSFRKILGSIKKIKEMDLQVCCTLGMLNYEQATQLKEAGLHTYNHNLDTSKDFYPEIISTRSFDERIKTLENVRKAGLTVCSGIILGLGEEKKDRISILQTYANMKEHPETFPVNALVSIEGTPLYGDNIPPVTIWDMGRMIATARILMPKTKIKIAAGRNRFTEIEQSMMFMAGANSIFVGDKLLTIENQKLGEDEVMFKKLGINL